MPLGPRGGLGGVRMGHISNLPIYIAIAPENPFLVMPFVFYVSTNPGPRSYVTEQVHHTLPFTMQLFGPEEVVIVWAAISADLPYFPTL